MLRTIDYQESNRVPIDLGDAKVTCCKAGALVRLRRHLGLQEPVRVHDAFQMVGEVTIDPVERYDIWVY